jgi:hypothetical protein
MSIPSVFTIVEIGLLAVTPTSVVQLIVGLRLGQGTTSVNRFIL